MKLVRSQNAGGQCRSLTKSGTQCSRKPYKEGFCKQHYKQAKESGELIELFGKSTYTQIPDPPIALQIRGTHSWKIYAKLLIDEKRFYQSYLYPLADLCALEDELEEYRKLIRDYGAVNDYGKSGIQRNGYASHFDRLLGHIRSLRADYRLTDAHKKEVKVTKEEKPQGVGRKKISGYVQ